MILFAGVRHPGEPSTTVQWPSDAHAGLLHRRVLPHTCSRAHHQDVHLLRQGGLHWERNLIIHFQYESFWVLEKHFSYYHEFNLWAKNDKIAALIGNDVRLKNILFTSDVYMPFCRPVMRVSVTLSAGSYASSWRKVTFVMSWFQIQNRFIWKHWFI